MTTDISTPIAPTLEAPLGDKAPAGDGTEAPKPDLAALLTAAEARATKAENDLKAAQGRNRPQLEIAALRQEWQEEAAAQRAILKALVKGQTGELEPQDVQKEVADLDRRTVQTSQERRFATRYSNLLEQFTESNTDDDGKLLLPWESEGMAGIVTRWNEAMQRQDLDTLTDLLAEGTKVISREVRTRAKKQAEAHKNELTATEKRAREEALKGAGAFDNGAGQAAGGGGAADQELVNKLGRGEPLTTDEMVKASQAMGKGLRPKR